MIHKITNYPLPERTVLECDADRHKFGIYILPKGENWKSAKDKALYGYTNAFYLRKHDNNQHVQQMQPYIFCGKCKTNEKYRGTMNQLKSKGKLVVCNHCKEAQHKECIRFFDKDEDIDDYCFREHQRYHVNLWQN